MAVGLLRASGYTRRWLFLRAGCVASSDFGLNSFLGGPSDHSKTRPPTEADCDDPGPSSVQVWLEQPHRHAVRWRRNAELLANDCRSRHARHNLPVAPAIAPEEALAGVPARCSRGTHGRGRRGPCSVF
jgi:hypothetical protein